MWSLFFSYFPIRFLFPYFFFPPLLLLLFLGGGSGGGRAHEEEVEEEEGCGEERGHVGLVAEDVAADSSSHDCEEGDCSDSGV